jgi:hypothetical protein
LPWLLLLHPHPLLLLLLLCQAGLYPSRQLSRHLLLVLLVVVWVQERQSLRGSDS